MSAESWPALAAQLSLTEPLFWVLRFIAGVGGAFLGWFLTDPLTRLTYRLIARQPVPGWVLPWTKMAGAATLGLLVFFFIPLGEGGGGLGWGPGPGGGPSKGKGASGDGGTDKDGTKKPPTTDTRARDATDSQKTMREVVAIELLGGPRYPGGGKYYLLDRREPPRTLDEIEAYLKRRKGHIEVHLVLTEQSVGRRHTAYLLLLDRLRVHGIPFVEPPEPAPPAVKD